MHFGSIFFFFFWKMGFFRPTHPLNLENSRFFFFFFEPFPNLKIISRHKFFFKYWGRRGPLGPGGHLMPPLWSLAYIKYVAAAIIRGVADILHCVAIILYNMASILSNVQHQFFESVFEFSKGKIHFLSRVLKNSSICQITDYHFFFGGGCQNPN